MQRILQIGYPRCLDEELFVMCRHLMEENRYMKDLKIY